LLQRPREKELAPIAKCAGFRFALDANFTRPAHRALLVWSGIQHGVPSGETGQQTAEAAMHDLDDADGVGSIVLHSETAISRVKMRCPHCERETSLERALPVDQLLRCESCGIDSEFRQLRETWCESRRSILERACPEIAFPHESKR
jgi:hypothetical protein